MMRKIRLQRTAGDRLESAFARDLNEHQRAAVTAPDGFNLILAGPGSGKTRAITYRVAYLIARGVPAESILLVTFTRRAAREMVGRLESLVGAQATRVWAGTFHHIGNRILRRSAELLGYKPNFTILDSEDQVDLLKLAMDEAGLSGQEKLAPKPALVQSILSLAFNSRVGVEALVEERYPSLAEWLPQLAAVARAYERRKRQANCMDYDDLLGLWAKLIAEHPAARREQATRFRHILVDELQDTNLIQIEIVETLAREGHGNLTAVGDDAQSIYRFRGAHYENILKFPERNPAARVYHLDINYRSTPEIVALTNAVLERSTSGFPRRLVSARPRGALPVVAPTGDSYEEAELICQLILEAREQGIPLNRQAVLYRNHHDSILLQGELVARGIPYSVRSGLRFFEQAHIKDVLAYLRVQTNPLDEAAWRRLLLLLPGIGPAKGAAIFEAIQRTAAPLEAVESAAVMKLVPARGRGLFAGFVADLRRLKASRPESNPAGAIQAILQGGYPAMVRSRYERPENRIADIEQMALLAGRYDSLERLVSDLLLAGDVYGVDTLETNDPEEILVMSTVHQAKGLEWPRVYIPRLVDDSFPHARALDEPGGEDEERRIFYVAISRAMDELFLTYPLMTIGRGRGSSYVSTPSRFLTELDPALYETVGVETDVDLAWSSRHEGPGGS
jgi:DNA helicase-2/ATP-dependent DNA helicase PcrA